MKRGHLKVVNPVRFFIFILICIMIIVFAGYSIIGAGRAEAATVTTYERVVINDGDTLWNIAERYNPDADMSTRDIVYDICDYNKLNAGDIQPGDVVYVPVY